MSQYGYSSEHHHYGDENRGYGHENHEQSYYYKSESSTTSSHAPINPRFHSPRQVLTKPLQSSTQPVRRMTISPAITSEAERIHDMLQGKHTDEGQNAIFDMLAGHPNETRQLIKRAYRNAYKEEMQESISKAFKGSDEVLDALLNLPEDYDAKALHKAMKGLGTNEATLAEIVFSRTNDEIRDAGYSYRHWFGQSLHDDLVSETSGDFRTMLVSVLKGERKEDNHVDHNLAMAIAQALADKKNDDYKMVEVLTSQGYPQLLEIGNQYQAFSGGKDFVDGIKKEFGGDAEIAALAIYKLAHGKPEFFAELIHDSVAKGHHDVLMRVVGSRETKDLAAIRYAFEDMYHIPLDNFVQDTLTDKKAHDAREAALHLIRSAR